MERLIGPCREPNLEWEINFRNSGKSATLKLLSSAHERSPYQTPGHVTAWTSTSNWILSDLDMSRRHFTLHEHSRLGITFESTISLIESWLGLMVTGTDSKDDQLKVCLSVVHILPTSYSHAPPIRGGRRVLSYIEH